MENAQTQLTITLTDQNDNLVNCNVISTIECNRKDYIALIPEEKDENNSYNLLLFRYSMHPDGIQLHNITSDMEFDEVARKFEEQIDNNNEKY